MATLQDMKSVVIRQAELGMRSEFGLTAIKIEFEGKLRRGSSPTTNCVACEGSGRMADPEHPTICEDCEYNDDGTINYECEYFYDDCSQCHGNGTAPSFRQTEFCNQWLLGYLSRYDMAERDVAGKWKPKLPLRYSLVYNDPSVDTEWTTTLFLRTPEDILLLPKLGKAWRAFADAVGNGLSTDNAGMHMSLLNHPEGTYDVYHNLMPSEVRQFANFEKSMRLLMPALFFLGSSTEFSRGMHFRVPQCSQSKFSAIHLAGNALEFRVFETCYDNPQQLLDNFVVMRQCIRFWRETYRSPKLEKICTSLKFGNSNGNSVDRLYPTATHLDLLNAGIRKIKPSYRTIEELKKQRGFSKTKASIKGEFKREEEKAKLAYKEYEDRFRWDLMVKKHANIYMGLDKLRFSAIPSEEDELKVLRKIQRGALKKVKELETNKKSVDHYISDALANYKRQINRGDVTLTA